MDELIDTIKATTAHMSGMADKLSRAGFPDLCAEMDQLTDELHAALRQAVELKIEIKAVASGASEDSGMRSPIALKQELDQVADRMRKLKETMRQPES